MARRRGPSPDDFPAGARYATPRMSAAARFALLFAAQFGALGIMLPFFPAVLRDHGLGATQIAAVLATGSAVRLLASPLLGRAADALGDARLVLAGGAVLAALISTGYGWGQGFPLLMAVAALAAIAMAPVVPLADALAVAASRREGFDYGRARSAGSAAFILAAVLAGQVVALWGTVATVWFYCLLLLGTAAAALAVPAAPPAARGSGGFRAPFRDPAFPWLLPLSALIQGSHALYYGFATLHWQAQGLSPGLVGLLWAEGVVAEVALFLWGKPLVERLGPAGMALLAAGAGVVRWAVTAETTSLPALFLVQLLHALTFGAMHLGAMRVLGGMPQSLAATAQTLHASAGVGLAMGLLTFASGPLYQKLGGQAFWAMAALCVLSLPLAYQLREGLARRRPVA